MNETTQQPQNGPAQQIPAAIAKAAQRAIAILISPAETWQQIKNEPDDIKALYKEYLAYAAAIPAICGFIGFVRLPFFSFFNTLLMQALQYVVILGLVYAGAFIISSTAPRFSGKGDFAAAFKLTAYSSTPSALAGVFFLAPSHLSTLVVVLASLYGLYLAYCATPILLDVPQERRLQFLGAMVAVAVIAGLVVSATRPEPDFSEYRINIPGIGTTDLRQLDNLDQLRH